MLDLVISGYQVAQGGRGIHNSGHWPKVSQDAFTRWSQGRLIPHPNHAQAKLLSHLEVLVRVKRI